MTKAEILRIVREHMADCAGVSERDLDDHSERIAFRLAPKFAALIEENKRLRGILACAEIELISYLDQYTGTFGDECLRKLMTPNAPHEGRTADSSPGVPLDAVVGGQKSALTGRQ